MIGSMGSNGSINGVGAGTENRARREVAAIIYVIGVGRVAKLGFGKSKCDDRSQDSVCVGCASHIKIDNRE